MITIPEIETAIINAGWTNLNATNANGILLADTGERYHKQYNYIMPPIKNITDLLYFCVECGIVFNKNAIGIYQQYNDDETKAIEELITDLRSWL